MIVKVDILFNAAASTVTPPPSVPPPPPHPWSLFLSLSLPSLCRYSFTAVSFIPVHKPSEADDPHAAANTDKFAQGIHILNGAAVSLQEYHLIADACERSAHA